MRAPVVVSLPLFMPYAERVAQFVEGSIQSYRPEIFSELFRSEERIIAIMSLGIVVRKIAPLLHDKWNDPAVVVISPDFAYAIPVIGGHHGANDLAQSLSGLGLIPVISTATEARGKRSVEKIAEENGCDIVNRTSTRSLNASILSDDIPVYTIHGPAAVIAGSSVSVLVSRAEYCIGIGCRKGVQAEEIVEAIVKTLSEAQISPQEIFVYATTIKKKEEKGLIEAIRRVSGTLIFLDDDTINREEIPSSSEASRLGLRGVAEPCAVAISKKKEWIMRKRVYGRVTIAIAR